MLLSAACLRVTGVQRGGTYTFLGYQQLAVTCRCMKRALEGLQVERQACLPSSCEIMLEIEARCPPLITGVLKWQAWQTDSCCSPRQNAGRASVVFVVQA